MQMSLLKERPGRPGESSGRGVPGAGRIGQNTCASTPYQCPGVSPLGLWVTAGRGEEGALGSVVRFAFGNDYLSPEKGLEQGSRDTSQELLQGRSPE